MTDPKTVTIWDAQMRQPWTVPYGEGKWWVTSHEGSLKHALLHAQKTIGKLAAELEALDHTRKEWLSDEALDRVGDLAADLVSAALRIGNVTGRSIAHALIRRVVAKNGAVFDDKAHSFGAMICK